MKFRTEHGDVSLPNEALHRLDMSLHGKVESLFSFQSRPFSEDAARLVETLDHAIRQYKHEVCGPIEIMARSISDRWEVQFGGMQPDSFDRIVPKVGAVMDESARAGVIRFHNRALAKAKQYNDDLYQRSVLRLDADAASHLQTMNKTLYAFQQDLDQKIEAYEVEVSARAEEVKADLRDTTNEIERIRKEIRSLAKALTWDKIVLGFWVPLTFSVLCVAYALPQAVYDMAPLKAAGSKCLPPTWSCFLRKAPTLGDSSEASLGSPPAVLRKD